MRMTNGQPLGNASFLIDRIPFTHMSHKSPKFTHELNSDNKQLDAKKALLYMTSFSHEQV